MIGWLFTNIMAFIGVSSGWLNPFIGLMVYYSFAVLRPPFLWWWAFPDGGPRYMLYLALSIAVGWVISGFGVWSGLRKVWLPLAGLYLYILSGLYGTFFIALSREWAWNALYPQVTIAVMVTLAVTVIRSENQIRWFAWMLTAAFGYTAWVINSQWIFDGFNRIYLKGFGGIDNNGAAMIFVMAVPLSFFMCVHEKKWWVKALCILAALLEIHAVLLSFSRGGQLGLIMVAFAIFVVAMIALPRKGLTLLLAVFCVIIGLRLAGQEVRARFMTIMPFLGEQGEREASAESRFITWSAALRCIADNPMGVGPRNFNLISQRYGLPPNKSVHNLFLQAAADYGILGAAGLALFYVSAAWKAFWLAINPAAKRLNWPRYYGQMCAISLGGMLVCSMFIGMESVEHGFIIALQALFTAAYVDRITLAEQATSPAHLPELAEVLPPGSDEPDTPGSLSPQPA